MFDVKKKKKRYYLINTKFLVLPLQLRRAEMESKLAQQRQLADTHIEKLKRRIKDLEREMGETLTK